MGTHARLPNNYQFDWINKGLGVDWADVTVGPSAYYTVEYNGATYIRSDTGGVRLMPRFTIGANADFVVTIPFRVSSNFAAECERGFTLYAGEWNYFGLYFKAGGVVMYHDRSPDYDDMNHVVTLEIPHSSDSDDLTLRITYDASTFVTTLELAVNGVWFENPVATRTSISGGDLSTDWPMPLTLWFSGIGAGFMAIGEGTIVRTATSEVLAGAYDYCGWSYHWNNTFNTIDWSPYMSYLDPPNPTPNIPAIWASTEFERLPGGLQTMPYDDEPGLQTLWKAGTFNVPSGAIYGAPTRLKVWGVQGPVGQGYARVRVLDSALQLVSDSEITGNSTGFFPNLGHLTPGVDIDLSGVTTEPIYLEFGIQFSGTGASQPWEDPIDGIVLPPTLHGFAVEGTLQVEAELAPASGSGTASAITATAGSFASATLAPAAGTGTASPLTSTHSRYMTATLAPAAGIGSASPVAAQTGVQTTLAAAQGVGSCNPVSASFTRYVATEVASANAEGRASPITATVSTGLALFMTLKGANGVEYPMYIAGGHSAGFRFN